VVDPEILGIETLRLPQQQHGLIEFARLHKGITQRIQRGDGLTGHVSEVMCQLP